MTALQTLAVAVLAALALFGLTREAWRNGWLPVQCDNCRRIVQERHSHRRLLTAWRWVRLCDACDAEVRWHRGETL